jgi:hypothetical protein
MVPHLMCYSTTYCCDSDTKYVNVHEVMTREKEYRVTLSLGMKSSRPLAKLVVQL